MFLTILKLSFAFFIKPLKRASFLSFIQTQLKAKNIIIMPARNSAKKLALLFFS
jgi:hypothetical protein